jgi:WD repeat-containing protein 68
MGKLKNHKDCVNSISWAPCTNSHLCSVGDDSQAFIWDMHTFKEENYYPFLEYKAENEISNLTWSVTQP